MCAPEGLGNIEGVVTGIKCLDEKDNNGVGSNLQPNKCMEEDENTNTIDFGTEYTHYMTIEGMMSERYKEFNKALSDLVCLVDMYSMDKKTIKHIKKLL